MTEIPEKRGPVAIKIEGGRNIRLDNNVSVGMPLLDATNVDNLSGSGNKTFGYIEPTPTPRKAWYERAPAKAITALVITVAAAGIIYALGWN
jgi:hypothetical protein